MPEKQTIERARRDKRQGKAPSTQAGEFVREEFHHVRKGKHGARSPQQAIAIGLSKARRAGVKLRPPSSKRSSPKVRRQAQRDYEKGQSHPAHTHSTYRGRIMFGILKHEGYESASTAAISRQSRTAAKRKASSGRSKAARKTGRAKGPRRVSATGKKAARTRRR